MVRRYNIQGEAWGIVISTDGGGEHVAFEDYDRLATLARELADMQIDSSPNSCTCNFCMTSKAVLHELGEVSGD